MSHRTQITLTNEQYERLRRESKRTGLGLAELVRRALDRQFSAVAPDDASRALDESFAAWDGREYDGEQYVDGMRRGLGRRLAR